jgi:hypothetical protein
VILCGKGAAVRDALSSFVPSLIDWSDDGFTGGRARELFGTDGTLGTRCTDHTSSLVGRQRGKVVKKDL